MAKMFIVNDFKIDDNIMYIYNKDIHHILVLRKNINDEIIVNNNLCKILDINKEYIKLNIINKVNSGVPNINIKLYMSFIKNEKMELVIQKAVELGVSNITPIFTKNCVIKLDDKDKIKKKNKFETIVNEAKKQCFRTDEVIVDNFLNFNELLTNLKKDKYVLLAYEKDNNKLKQVINNIKLNNNITDISVIIGPEGGFDLEEINILNKLHNIYLVSLGSRILRAETAAISLISNIMYEFE